MSYGQHDIGANAPQAQPEIPACVERISARLDDLQSTAMGLEERLAPIVAQEPPAKSTGPHGELLRPASQSALGDRLQSHEARLSLIVTRLSSLLSRLQV